ncbi:MAG: LamG-like jellyroll fold domain-containing protein [Planctomycetota bacterium]
MTGFTITTGWLELPQEDLLSHWELDEDSGLTAYDSIGGHDGTLTNFPGDDSQWVAGRLNGSLDFDGIDDYVEMDDPAYKGITGTQSRTCAAWIKTSSTDGSIISWGDTNGAGNKWLLRVQSTGRLRIEVQGGYKISSTIVNDGIWHHVAAVLIDDGSPDVDEVKLYIDGQEESFYSSVSSQGINTVSGTNVSIGAALFNYPSLIMPFTGQIDDVRIYDRVLFGNEIKLLSQSYTWDGGGVLGNGTSAEISKCVIKNNAAQNLGGGLFSFDGKIDRCIITGNLTNDSGGGVAGSDAAITNCLIYNNSAVRYAGGLYKCNGPITNCTIANNTADERGGVRRCRGPISNCIIWGNTPYRFFGGRGRSYSCIQGGSSGLGNIDIDPCFVDAFNGDYRLLASSPSINTGDPNHPVDGNERDINGQPRVMGGRVDMGAYEFIPPLEVEMKFTPQALNPGSRGGWVKAHLVLPEGFVVEALLLRM